MDNIRKIERTINKYEWLIVYDIDVARKNCEAMLENIETIEELIDIYIKITKQVFLMWCDTSVDVTEEYYTPENIFTTLKMAINLIIVNHYLDKYSRDLTKISRLERRTKKIKGRLVQFKYL